MPSIDDDHFLARHAADADGLSKPHHTDDGDECSGAKSQETHNTEEEEEGRRYLNDSKNTSFPLSLSLSSFAFQKQQRRQTVQEFKCGIDYLCCNIIPALSRKNSRQLPWRGGKILHLLGDRYFERRYNSYKVFTQVARLEKLYHII